MGPGCLCTPYGWGPPSFSSHQLSLASEWATGWSHTTCTEPFRSSTILAEQIPQPMWGSPRSQELFLLLFSHCLLYWSLLSFRHSRYNLPQDLVTNRPDVWNILHICSVSLSHEGRLLPLALPILGFPLFLPGHFLILFTLCSGCALWWPPLFGCEHMALWVPRTIQHTKALSLYSSYSKEGLKSQDKQSFLFPSKKPRWEWFAQGHIRWVNGRAGTEVLVCCTISGL